MDLLEGLPLDLFGVGIWSSLGEAAQSRSNFRLSCSRARNLADLLIASATLGQATPAPLTDALRRAAQLQQIERSCAFLSRLPRLAHVQLLSWPDDTHLIACLRAYGAASQGRPTTLSLHHGVLTAASSSALVASFPRLAVLRLAHTPDGMRPRAGRVLLEGDVFQPMLSSPLVELYLGNCRSASLAFLASLGRLHRLHTLHIAHVHSSHLHLLSGLTHLRHCSLWHHTAPALLTDAAALLALTRLTLLALQVKHGGDGAAHPTAGPPAPAPNPGALQAAVRLLGGLTQLRILELGTAFEVDDAVFAQLSQITRLATLAAGSLRLTRPTAGHLSGLSTLSLRPGLSPSQLLQSLLPLMPLPSLEDLHCRWLDIGCDPPVDAQGPAPALQPAQVVAAAVAEQAAPLRRVAGLLAAAPRLSGCNRETMNLCLTHPLQEEDDGAHLSLAAIAHSLQPLAPHLRKLGLSALDLWEDTEWGLLARSLPGLLYLSLSRCDLLNAAPAAIAVAWPALVRLDLWHCEGVTDKGWAMLCAARARGPLAVRVEPRLGAGVVAECAEAQHCMYGRQNVVWVHV